MDPRRHFFSGIRRDRLPIPGGQPGPRPGGQPLGKAKTVLQMAYVIIFMFLAIILEYMESYSTWAQAQELPVEAYASYLGLYSLIAIILVAFYTVCSGIAFARVNWKALGLDQTQ